MPPFVRIRVTGSKKLVPQLSMEEVECDVNWTWIQFLREKYQLEFTLSDKIVVRKVSYPLSKGWEAKLRDKVQEFIQKFARVKTSYKVRLTMKRKQYKKRQIIRPNAIGVRRVGSPVYRVSDNPSSSSTVERNQSNVSQFHPGLDLEPHENNDFIFDDDVRSVTTAMERNELARQGIADRMIKPVVASRLATIDNAELLRIQQELKSLVDDSLWHRLIYRIPRAAHLLSNIFGIDTSPHPGF